MTLRNWEQVGDTRNKHTRTTNKQTDGEYSLRIDSVSKAFQVSKATIGASPKEADLRTEINVEGGSQPAFIFRYQDPDNFYALNWFTGPGVTNPTGYNFVKFVDGNRTKIQDRKRNDGFWNFPLKAYNSNARSTWWRIRARMWVEDGEFYARCEQPDGSGGWSGIVGPKLADTSPDLVDGGGVGLGSLDGRNFASADVYFDETEIRF